MDGMSSSSGFDSASYSQEYGSDIKKMGGTRKRRVTRRGGQYRTRAGGKKWGGKRCTKRRGGKKCRSKKNKK